MHLAEDIDAMSPKALLARLPVDPYIAAIVGMVCLASGLPAYGNGAIIARYATYAAIALLFFLHGALLSPQAALAGASHWRLHIVVLASTFVRCCHDNSNGVARSLGSSIPIKRRSQLATSGTPPLGGCGACCGIRGGAEG